jgi:GTP-binding protein
MGEEKILRNISFVGSFPKASLCPQQMLPEYAFMGRSNVGKSSLLNYLASRKNLARVSSNPGKTQSLNFYLVEGRWHLVDLPGYGYAKVSKKERQRWSKMIESYLLLRKQLVCAFQLIDFSIDPQQIDLEQSEWLATNHIPFAIIFTKTDKIKRAQRERQLKKFVEKYMEEWSEMPSYLISSVVTRQGREEILTYIERINDSWFKQLV